MVAASEPFYGVPIVTGGNPAGTSEKPRLHSIFNVLGMWCVADCGHLSLHAAARHGGLISAWVCMIAHNLLLFVLFGVHYLTGRWKK